MADRVFSVTEIVQAIFGAFDKHDAILSEQNKLIYIMTELIIRGEPPGEGEKANIAEHMTALIAAWKDYETYKRAALARVDDAPKS